MKNTRASGCSSLLPAPPLLACPFSPRIVRPSPGGETFLRLYYEVVLTKRYLKVVWSVSFPRPQSFLSDLSSCPHCPSTSSPCFKFFTDFTICAILSQLRHDALVQSRGLVQQEGRHMWGLGLLYQPLTTNPSKHHIGECRVSVQDG